MTTHLVTFASNDMSRSAELCVESALKHGADHAVSVTQAQFRQSSVYKENKALFDQPRGGGGYFAWKPFVIGEEMRGLEDGTILIYSDAGVEFIDNVNYIIDRTDQDIFLFGNMWEHAHWCKRDIIDEIIPLNFALEHWRERYSANGWALAVEKERPALHWDNFGKQVQASVIFFRVSDYTRKFVKEWLDWCLFEGGRLVDDSPSRTPNHPEFQENRYDQAILTTMAYRDGVTLHWWPAEYNRFVPGGPIFTYERGNYPDEGYPTVFHHHRRRNIEWEIVANA